MENTITGFNIYEQLEPTNKDITISFNPDPTYKSYKLIIKKDEEIYKTITKINIVPTEITLSESGTYKIEVLYYDEEGNETNITSGTYTIDKIPPVIKVNKNYYEIFLGKKFDVMSIATATDNLDKNITDKIKTNKNELNFEEKGTKKLIYTVSDTAGNSTNKEVLINVTHSSTSIVVLQTMFTVILLLIALGILIYNNSTRLERKISRFSISPIKDTTLSLFDNISLAMNNFIEKINKILYKSEFTKKYSKKYTKYSKRNTATCDK